MSPKVLETEARKKVAAARQSEQAILELVETVIAGWNSHDMKVFASPFAEDADFVNVAGQWLRGRQEIADRQDERFRSSRLRADRISIRFVRPDVAVVHFRWETAGDRGPDGWGVAVRHGITTFLASEDQGRWRFDAAQNTDSQPN